MKKITHHFEWNTFKLKILALKMTFEKRKSKKK